jgi:CAAX protease family protein
LTARGLIAARGATTNWLLVYGGFILLGEAILVLVNVTVGILLQAAILVAVVSHNSFARPPRDPQLPVLGLVPLIRLLSIAMPIPDAAPITAYVLVGAPALLGVVLSARAIGVSRSELGLGRPTSVLESAMIASIGLPLGLVARSIGGPSPLAVGDVNPLLFVAVLLPFVVLLEELVFRGLLQRVATTRSRLLGILAPNVLYAAMYFGSGSAVAVLFMALTGALFGWFVARSGSLWGVLGAHLIFRLVIQL